MASGIDVSRLSRVMMTMAAVALLHLAATPTSSAQAPAAAPATNHGHEGGGHQMEAEDEGARVGASRSVPGTKVYFIGIKDGEHLPAKFTVHFGLRGMGVAPAGTNRPNTGHHHLIIDADLPPPSEPIPNDFNHLHFGAGQTEAEVELTPGDHTLQLLFGDKDHYSFNPAVASDRITIHVGDGDASTADVDSAGAYKAKASAPNTKLYIESPADGAVVPPTFSVKFGLRGMGIAPAGVARAYTGHHHLLVDTAVPPLDQPIPNDFNHYHFGQGQTESQVTLTPGPHTLQLLLGDANHYPHQPAVMSQLIKVYVRSPKVGSRHGRTHRG